MQMQNAIYFGMVECKMPKVSGICLVLPKMAHFWVFLSLEVKIQNGE